MNNNVVIYRSKSEQAYDEFWWSEGYFTATKSSDAIIIGVVVCIIVFVGARIFGR